MATPLSILAWRIPWTEEPWSWGLKRVGQDLVTKQQQHMVCLCARSLSRVQLFVTLRSTAGFPIFHSLPELAQTHVK